MFELVCDDQEDARKKISFHFQCATWKLEKALGGIPYDQFEISEEVEEQVRLTDSLESCSFTKH